MYVFVCNVSMCHGMCRVQVIDHDGDALNLAFIQYHFSQGEHGINVAPHGNARHGQPYWRTMPSVLGKLRKEAKEKNAQTSTSGSE